MGDPAERHRTVQRALAEVEAEADARRATLPDDYEEGLRRLFDELSPQGASAGSLLRQSLQVVDERAGLDLRPPVASAKPGLPFVKRLIAKAIGWYVRFLAAQSARFAAAVARALHVVADDLDRLRDELAMARPDLTPASVPQPERAGRWWAPVATEALAGVRGRVLHADCGDGALLAALAALGIDAVGLDPSAPSAVSVLEELEVTPTGVLGGVVLEGSVQWLGASPCDRLVGLAADRLAEGGVVVVASATPEAWAKVAPAVVADLAPGRPLHPETWAHLFARHGFAAVAVHRGGRDRRTELADALGATTPAGAAGAAPAWRVALEALVDGPDEFVVTAVAGAR